MQYISKKLDLICYPLMATDSRKAMKRLKKADGSYYRYNPRTDLLNRLSSKLGKPIDWIEVQISKERLQIQLHQLEKAKS